MKRCVLNCLIICLFGFCTVAPIEAARANPIAIIIKAAIKKVIKAMDLMIQRIQNNTIKLQNLQKQLENQLSKLKLTEIAEWSEKTRAIYDKYFKELWEVKNLISTYRRVREVIDQQVALVQAYKRAWQMLSSDRNFSPQEVDYMYKVYSGILDDSIKNISELELVIGAFVTQMSDAKRLEIINQVSKKIEQNYADLTQFTNQNAGLSVQRAKSTYDVLFLKRMYGIE